MVICRSVMELKGENLQTRSKKVLAGSAPMRHKGRISGVSSVQQQPYHELWTTRALSDMSETLIHAG
jgi:hypothetical protein